MEADSSNQADSDHKTWKNSLPLSTQLLVVAMNYFSVLFIAALLALCLLPWQQVSVRVLSVVAILYLFPPVCARLVLLLFPVRLGIVRLGSADFLKWCFLMNLQLLFCRFDFLEEFLRAVPGAYGMWLRLWGAKIGSFIYWAPGLRILDRSFIRIGDDVVFGAGVRLNPHVMMRDAGGNLVLALDYVTIGSKTLIGGYSLFTAGDVIEPDQTTRANLSLPPFTRWKDGRRVPGNEDAAK